jgi:hypothetical protein
MMITITNTGACSMYPCKSDGCPCDNVFGGECGSFEGDIYLTFHIQANYTAWLQVVGISNIQTHSGTLSIGIGFGEGLGQVDWPINVFPNLQVARGWLELFVDSRATTTLSIMPGPGLSRLRAAAYFGNSYGDLPSLGNKDLAFLSSLECLGAWFILRAPKLQSLRGLERVSDGIGSGCVIEIPSSNSTLRDVSALSRYARCGTVPHPYSDGQPCLAVACPPRSLGSWADVCNYIARGPC